MIQLLVEWNENGDGVSGAEWIGDELLIDLPARTKTQLVQVFCPEFDLIASPSSERRWIDVQRLHITRAVKGTPRIALLLAARQRPWLVGVVKSHT